MTWGAANISRRALMLCKNQTLKFRGKNTRTLLKIDGTRVKNMKHKHGDTYWTTLVKPIHNGTVLTFSLETMPEAPLEFQFQYTKPTLEECSISIDDLVESMKEAPRIRQGMIQISDCVDENGAGKTAPEPSMEVELIEKEEASSKHKAAHVADASAMLPSSLSVRRHSSSSRDSMRMDETALGHLRDSIRRKEKDAYECDDLMDFRQRFDAHGKAFVATLDDKSSDVLPDEPILQKNDHFQESLSIPEQESQLSAMCTQDLLEKISCDIDECEQNWPASSERQTVGETLSSHTSTMNDGAHDFSHQPCDTNTKALTRIGAQIVSGDEAQAMQQDTARTGSSREEPAVADDATAIDASGLAFESTNDSIQEAPATKKRRSDDARVPIRAALTHYKAPAIEPPLDENVDDTNTIDADHPLRPPFRVMFVKLGYSCSTQVLPFKVKQAKTKGAIVVDSLEENPTHLLIDSKVTAEKLAEKLNFGKRGIPKLIKYLEEHDIETVKMDWLEGPDRLKNPKMDQLWTGLAFHRNKAGVKRKLALPSKPKPGSSNRVLHSFASNDAISLMFHKLAKLHQECALRHNDEFRALTNNLISGRVKFLDFEITPDNLDRVKKIKGIGESSVGKLKEFFDRRDGSCNRIEEFEKDEQRMAVRTMKNIWGVGISKAQDLMLRGYRTIDEVRKGLESGDLRGFTPNQLIGVKYYEDFLERMTREEVEEIAGIVKEAVRERFPKANVTIMGSYRRGKETCGDIDLLITDPDYLKTTPRGALGELVSRLAQRGHISFHLTRHLEGMSNGTTESQSSYDGIQCPIPLPQDPGTDDGKPSSSSYMGVFCSPVVPGKMRRIDIKFYPHRERVFAAIYFVGNGWFNRSMRRWASSKNFSLDDRGLFPVARNQRTGPKIKSSVFYPSTERELFDHLGLVYKEPTDRNYFDDVIPLDESVNDWDPHSMTETELMRDVAAHSGPWID
jgi:DNA polymerase/3'-5' exonuclease PolX